MNRNLFKILYNRFKLIMFIILIVFQFGCGNKKHIQKGYDNPYCYFYKERDRPYPRVVMQYKIKDFPKVWKDNFKTYHVNKKWDQSLLECLSESEEWFKEFTRENNIKTITYKDIVETAKSGQERIKDIKDIRKEFNGRGFEVFSYVYIDKKSSLVYIFDHWLAYRAYGEANVIVFRKINNKYYFKSKILLWVH